MSEIKFVRDVEPRQRDFKVFIDNEHRATFLSNQRWGRKGYDLKAADGDNIRYGKMGRYHYSQGIVQADFEAIVREVLADIPTVAEIERTQLIREAEKENEQRKKDAAAHRTRVRRQVLKAALQRYVNDSCSAPTSEHREMANFLLNERWGFDDKSLIEETD